MGYTKRIARPQIYYLNPYINNSNPYLQTTGNAILKPELSDNIELRITKQDKKSNYYILTLSFQQGKNSIVSVVSPINDSTIISTFGNWRRQYLLGLSFYSSFSLWKKVQLNFSNNLYWSNYPKSFWPLLNSQLTGNNGIIGSIGLSLSGSFLKRVRYSINNSFNLPDVYLQGHGSSFFYQDFTFTYPFSKNHFLGIVSFRQPFNNRYTYRTFYAGKSFTQISLNETPQARVFAGIRYSFGTMGKANVRTRKKINNEDKKNKNSLDNIK